ncbi:MAG: DUF6106 family protein [Eubacterium sp.]|nr:DUF6106 family protein [Eubacterium sp.]
MDDLFTELLIKKQKTGKDTFLKTLAIGFTVLLFLAGILITPLFLLLGLGMAAVDYFLLPRLNVEYEYSYVSGELDIDKIFNKEKRKKGGEYSVKNFEIMAPLNSDRLSDYKKNSQIKTIDYTSGDPDDGSPVYAFVTSDNGQRQMILFQPDDRILKDMRMRAPSKVFLN